MCVTLVCLLTLGGSIWILGLVGVFGCLYIDRPSF